MFDWASIKATARQTVQDTFGVQAFYSDAAISVPLEMRARLHDRQGKPYGGLVDGDGYADLVESIDQIVLIPVAYITGAPVTLQRNGEFTFPTMFPGAVFTLDLRIPSQGPLEERWQVSRK